MEQERRIRREEEEIKNYYKRIENREKRISGNESNLPTMKQATQPYQTYPNESHHDSRAKALEPQRPRGHSKPALLVDGDIPLLPVMQQEDTGSSSFQGQGLVGNSKINGSGFNSGSIPLLDLSEDHNSLLALKTKKGKKTKR